MKCSQGTSQYIYNISLAVTTDCNKGQLFSVYTYNKFATSLTDACLHEGDLAAFCAACVRESSQYRIEEGCHHLEAHMGLPEHPSAKIIFSRKPHITVSLLLYFCLYVSKASVLIVLWLASVTWIRKCEFINSSVTTLDWRGLVTRILLQQEKSYCCQSVECSVYKTRVAIW